MGWSVRMTGWSIILKLNETLFFIGLKDELLLVFDLHTFISTVNNWNIQETSRVH